MQAQIGVTLIELLVTLVVFAILISVGAPNVMNWIQNGQIRTAGESIVNGLQMARAEAVHRNTNAKFILCGSDSSWDVLVASPTGTAQVCAGNAASATGWDRVESHSGSEGSANAKVAATQNSSSFTSPVIYDGLGRISPLQSYDINLDVSNPVGGKCICGSGTCGYPTGVAYSTTGPMRCMRIVVSTGGQARMCNPALSLSNNPQGCP